MGKRATDWDRYALLSHVSKSLEKTNDLGRKAMQKIVYLMQVLGEIPLGFSYMFYTYGVYSVELANTLSAVESMGGIDATYDEIQNAYHLHPGKTAGVLEKHGSEFLKNNNKAIDQILELARGQTAKVLELVSTIVYVVKVEKVNASKDEEKLVSRVGELKPKFSEMEIKSKILDLKKAKFL